jgi:hypothetical protein
MSSHFNIPEFDHKSFSKFLNENKLTPSSKLNSLNESIEEAIPFEKDALDEITASDIQKKYNEMFGKNPQTTFADVAKALGKSEHEIFKALMGIKNLEEKSKKYYRDAEEDDAAHIEALEKDMEDDKKSSEELEEMANFFTITKDQKDKIDPNKYTGTKKLVAQALKGDEVEVGQPFTKATIKAIIGKDPLKDFNSVLDSEEIGGLGKTSDVRPQEPKTPGVRGRKPGTSTPKEPSMSMTRDKVVGVKDIDGPRSADVTAAEKELGGAKGIERTIAIDKAGKAIIDKLKNSKEQLKDPKFKEAKRLAFIAYLTRPKSEGGKIGLRKGGETYTNLLNVWDNTVEDLIS